MKVKLHRYFDEQYKRNKSDTQRREIEKARAASLAYLYKYEDEGLVCRGIEVPFTLPILDPETGERTGRWYGGLIDAIIELDGHLWLCDHKTASNADKSYWDELKTNPQLSMYLLAAKQIGLNVRGFLWDVIRKPGISPKALSKADIKELDESSSYCNLPYTGEPVQYGDKENARLFGMRLFRKYVDESDKQFERRKIFRQEFSLYDYLVDLNDITKQIEDLRVSVEAGGRSTRNLSNCKSFNRLCDYHSVCAGEVDIDDDVLFRKKSKAKREGGGPASGSYSTSQISLYQGCQRKWVHRYVDKVEPIGLQAESLYFGTLVHSALEIILKEKLVDPIVFPNEID